MKNESNYQWQGETVEVEFGFCVVKTNKELPMFWYNYECRETGMHLCEAIRITSNYGSSFTISNRFGYGITKLKKGGWPDHGHSSLPEETFEKSNLDCYRLTDFDLERWEERNIAADKWFQYNHPYEFKKLKAAMEVARSGVIAINARFKSEA